MSDSETVTVDLGEFAPRVQARIDSGEFETASEVIRAGIEALDREDADFDRYLREKVKDSLDDPRPSIPADEVFDRILQRHEELMHKQNS